MAIWYRVVKSKTGWSDYKLDVEIATDRGMGYAQRLRRFETIGRQMCIPRRSANDLIVRTDRYRQNGVDLSGTKALYDSELWHLLRSPSTSLLATQRTVTRLLRKLKLCRSDDLVDLFILDSTRTKSSSGGHERRMRLYRRHLKRALAGIDFKIDALALVLALFKEAYFAGALEVAIACQEAIFELHDAAIVTSNWLASGDTEMLESFRSAIVSGVERTYTQRTLIEAREPTSAAERAGSLIWRQDDPALLEAGNEARARMDKIVAALRQGEMAKGRETEV